MKKKVTTTKKKARVGSRPVERMVRRRFECWAGIGGEKTVYNILSALKGEPKEFDDAVVLWGIVDTENVKVSGTPKNNEYFCFATDPSEQSKICELLNKYYKTSA